MTDKNSLVKEAPPIIIVPKGSPALSLRPGDMLYNSAGIPVGEFIEIVEYDEELCFSVDDGESQLGNFWQMSRLDSGRDDQITADEEKAAQWRQRWGRLGK